MDCVVPIRRLFPNIKVVQGKAERGIKMKG